MGLGGSLVFLGCVAGILAVLAWISDRLERGPRPDPNRKIITRWFETRITWGPVGDISGRCKDCDWRTGAYFNTGNAERACAHHEYRNQEPVPNTPRKP